MKAVVDRIEENIVVLALCDKNGSIVRLPFYLVPDAREGDLVDLLITKDEAGTTAKRENSREMIYKLDKKHFL
ncbi:MAG: DUF3006 domain-containing protein [Methanoregulaceae archaeon]|jgi:hypothetical protein|nr:DUF3006 domain-containing protein [Methanoregulaceae archaeon]